MRFLIQRVSKASVHIVDTNETNSIGEWFLIYMWVHKDDVEWGWKEKVEKFVRRVGKYDLFTVAGEKKKKSHGLLDIEGSILLISNFTLYGRNKKWSSIDFCHAAWYEKAEEVYEYAIEKIRETDITLQTGKFWAKMEVTAVNSGPVNIVLDY